MSQKQQQPQFTRLPHYFPTYVPQCKDQATAFFECFEKHAVMKDEKDSETPKHSLDFCQDSLREYIKCQDLQLKKIERSDGKAWWQFW